MLNEILQKSVSITLANGVNADGFVLEIDEDFIKLIEFDNSKIFIRKGDISLVRVYEGKGITHKLDNTDATNGYVASYYSGRNTFDNTNATERNTFNNTNVTNNPVPHREVYLVGKRNEFSMNNFNQGDSSGPKFERQTNKGE